jgi:hypothetical protein
MTWSEVYPVAVWVKNIQKPQKNTEYGSKILNKVAEPYRGIKGIFGPMVPQNWPVQHEKMQQIIRLGT